MATYKFDMFKAAEEADKQNGDWFAKQPADVRKAFVAPLFIRVASAVKGDGPNHEFALRMINEYVNIHAGELMTAHPELLFRLAAMCGGGKKLNHEWIPMAGRNKNGKFTKAHELLAKFNPDANDFEIDLLMSMYDKHSFKEFAETCGVPADEAKEAIKAYASKKG